MCRVSQFVPEKAENRGLSRFVTENSKFRTHRDNFLPQECYVRSKLRMYSLCGPIIKQDLLPQILVCIMYAAAIFPVPGELQLQLLSQLTHVRFSHGPLTDHSVH